MGALRGDLRAPGIWRTLEETAQKLLERKSPGDWNQAMMELGATLCTPKSPRCEECPVRKWCRAQALGIAEKLPTARKKPATVDVTLAAAVLLDPRGRTLLVRQPNGDGALFSRLWQFPALETTGRDAGAALSAYLREILGVTERLRLTPLAAARHSVTFRSIRLEPFLVRVIGLPQISGGRAVTLRKISGLPVSNATQKIVRAVLEHETIRGVVPRVV
jgi:A/G-specific adenine glycosylase